MLDDAASTTQELVDGVSNGCPLGATVLNKPKIRGYILRSFTRHSYHSSHVLHLHIISPLGGYG